MLGYVEHTLLEYVQSLRQSLQLLILLHETGEWVSLDVVVVESRV